MLILASLFLLFDQPVPDYSRYTISLGLFTTLKFTTIFPRSGNKVKQNVKQNATPHRICLQSLPPEITEGSLHEYFSKFGIVKDVGLLMEVICLGRGFVVFHDSDAVSKVMEAQPHKLKGKRITVSCTEEAEPTDHG
ncbi:unnamed protein product [Dibothriocephalus latus]|uniref:RRM domain-containing protein n=1 Tax=Dibothriocephalus latus TaxID=60516 RepID=A0A3P6QWK6_DIBLA|nr:unnamed protein product [Dibothriocephalus latus]